MQTIGRGCLQHVVVFAAMTIAVSANAQELRTRTPNPDAHATIVTGTPRNARFPYEGAWIGTRQMPMGTDEITVRFLVQNDNYVSVIVLPNGQATPERSANATSAGLMWEQANNGGGTWLYKVHLTSPDSLVGTLVLQNPPPNLTPAPSGTLTFKRVQAGR